MLRSRASSRSPCARSAARRTSPSRSSRLSAGSCVNAAKSRRHVPFSSRSKDDDDLGQAARGSRRRARRAAAAVWRSRLPSPGCGAASRPSPIQRRRLSSSSTSAIARRRPSCAACWRCTTPVRSAAAGSCCSATTISCPSRSSASPSSSACPSRSSLSWTSTSGCSSSSAPSSTVRRFRFNACAGTPAGRSRHRSPAASTRLSPTRRTRWRALDLFLARAVEALRGESSSVFLSFGSRRPRVQFEVQRTIVALGLEIRSLTRDFNDYVGAGVLGGTSHLYHLVVATDASIGESLYTGGRTSSPKGA